MFTLFFVILLFILAIAMFAVGKVKVGYSGDEINLRPWGFVPIVLGLLYFLVASINVVDPGNVAVPVTWGKASTPVDSGIHLLAPWTDLHNLSIKTQEYTMSSGNTEGAIAGDDSVSANSKDQAQVNIDSTVIYRIDPASAKDIYVKLGGDYESKFIRPTIREAIYAEAANYDATSLATTSRQDFADRTQRRIDKGLEKYNIVVADFKIRQIGLPAQLRAAVDQKIAAQQSAEKQQFLLQEKTQQAEQRRVEAKGLADSQQIIQSTLTPAYLQFEYIQTLQKLAGSPNTTFMFVPNDPGQLPNFQIPMSNK